MSVSTIVQKMKARTKWLYGLGDVGNATVNSAIQFFLMKFYTDAALILPALAGNALLIGKIWDAVNDPLFGWLTDRTKSKLGKRRVYMLFGAIPLGISIALLWFVPAGMSQVMTFVWIAATFILFDTLWTMTNVPYYALTSELTDDYDERSSLTVYRMALAVPFYLVGAALTPMIVGFFAVQRTGFGFIGIIYGALAAAALMISASGLRERKNVIEAKGEENPAKSIKLAFANKKFVYLCVIYFIVNISFAFAKTLMAYFIEYQLVMKDMIPVVMGLMLVCVTISLPIWKKIADKWDKGPAYGLGMGMGAVALLALFFLPNEPTFWIYPIMVLAGFGFGANWVFPWAMIADVSDYDRVETGQFRSGIYYGVWGLATKISEALALAGVGWMLTGFGYVANVAQSSQALLGIRLFFGIVPAVCIFAALPLLFKYPITRKGHAEVRARLEQMDAETAESKG
ncbi:MAG: MFS transporter [Anaerolineaceae bacterium]|jgi:GPH family glycoside/pentoside/hexuronide:cation symporter|nr:MFS transporter [Anaerolineaceae bacterium]